jgi:hypothetical protein
MRKETNSKHTNPKKIPHIELLSMEMIRVRPSSKRFSSLPFTKPRNLNEFNAKQ